MKNILIVVDMQKDFIDGSLANPAADAIVSNVCEHLRAFVGLRPTDDETELGIILTRDTHDYNYLNTYEGKHLPIPHCINGTEGWLVDKRIRDTLDSISGYCPISYLDKKTFGNDLDWYKFIDSVDGKDCKIYICGTCTDICVISNALILKVQYPEADIIVYKDACAGLTPAKHEAALEVMRSCQITVI